MKTPILIIGYERSGTTLLRRIVSMHPGLDYELIHEKPELLLKSENAEDAIKYMTYPGTQAGKKTGSIMSIRAGHKLAYVVLNDIHKLIKKFRELFPNSSIIHIIRDPLYAINSQVRTFKRDPNGAVRRYFNSVPRVSEFLSGLSNVYTILFDDLVSNPANTVSSLYSWMGEGVSKDYVKKVISTKEPWKHNGRVMPGLRYFGEIEKRNPKMVLSNKIVKLIKKLTKETPQRMS